MFLWQYYSPLYLLAILSTALIADMLIGDPERFYNRVPHPVAVIGRFLSLGEKLLNRGDNFMARLIGGSLWLALVLCLFIWGALLISAMENFADLRFVIEVILAQTLLASKSLYRHVKAVAEALRLNDLSDARAALQKLVSRDAARLDKAAIGRASVESLSENFSDAVVAPIFWFLLAGLPGLVFYKIVNTADSMWGYRSARYEAFGKIAARLDDVVNYFPARLSLLPIWLMALILPWANFKGAVKTVFSFASLHGSPNAGYPEAAFAGACGLALGGERHYPGVGTKSTWIGDGKKQVSAADARQALALYKGAVFVLLLLLFMGIFFVVRL